MSFSSSRLLPIMLLLGTLLPAAPAIAQATPAATPAPTANATPATATGAAPVVDESALRYFARQGDEVRLRAEIARLSAIYPGWVPPADPLASGSTVDPMIQQLWDLFGKGDLDGAKDLIAKRQTTEPSWRPPSDFTDSLAGAEAGANIRSAVAKGDNATAIALAATHPELLTCQNPDLLWGLGEAFDETGRVARAVDAFSYLLKNCDNDRLATMQKAQALFDEDTVKTLLALGRTTADGQAEFAPIQLDLARRRVADVLNGIDRSADPDALAMVEAAAKADKAPDDLRLLGYYELSNNRNRQARTWFEQAYKSDNSPASATGLATAMLRLNDGVSAEALLNDMRDQTPELEAQYLAAASAMLAGDPPRSIDPIVLERIIEAATETRSAQVAQDLGWYAFAFGQTETALQWFDTALTYDATFEPAAYGQVVANQKLRKLDKVRALMRQWGPVSERIRLFGQPNAPTTVPTTPHPIVPGPLQPAVFRWDFGTKPMFMLVGEMTDSQRRSLAQCNTFRPIQSLGAAAALARGWCLLDISRDTEAEAAFRQATLSPSANIRTDAYYGHTLALLRLGLVDDAAISASAMPQTPDRVKTIQITLLGTTATTYYGLGRYNDVLQLLDQRRALAPEENGLLTIRAWSYYHLNRLREAKQIFTAVAGTGYQDAQRGLDVLAARGF